MDRDKLREILDNMDARVYAFIDTGASLDEIKDMIDHRSERRLQAMENYVDSSFTGEDEIVPEDDETKSGDIDETKKPEEETKRAGRVASD